MGSKWYKPKNIDQFIIKTVKENRPRTVEQLVKLIEAEYLIPEQKILEYIIHLKEQRKLVFDEYPHLPSPLLLKRYILSRKSNWYWTIVVLSLANVVLVLTVPENATQSHMQDTHSAQPSSSSYQATASLERSSQQMA